MAQILSDGIMRADDEVETYTSKSKTPYHDKSPLSKISGHSGMNST